MSQWKRFRASLMSSSRSSTNLLGTRGTSDGICEIGSGSTLNDIGISTALSGQPGGEASPSVVELVGQRLVEHELWDWFGLGGIEGRSLVEEEISLGRTTRG